MKSVGLRVLKNRLSEYVRLAASGETVLVTDRDPVVAELPSIMSKEPPAGLPVTRLENLLTELAHDREDR